MITSIEQLKAIRDAYASKINFRQHNPGVEVTDGNIKKHVLICGGTGCTSSKSVQIKEKMEEAILKMEAEFRKGNNVDIPFLAEQCNMSQTYFRRLFHGLYGVSPKQYILSARLRWAKTMLKSTEDSVTEIAKNCGFDNVYYFSRAFHIHEGISPSQYRNQHREIGEKKNGA